MQQIRILQRLAIGVTLLLAIALSACNGDFSRM